MINRGCMIDESWLIMIEWGCPISRLWLGVGKQVINYSWQQLTMADSGRESDWLWRRVNWPWLSVDEQIHCTSWPLQVGSDRPWNVYLIINGSSWALPNKVSWDGVWLTKINHVRSKTELVSSITTPNCDYVDWVSHQVRTAPDNFAGFFPHKIIWCLLQESPKIPCKYNNIAVN